MRTKFAAQGYSFRKEFEEDFEKTIKEIKRIGFTAIQLDGMRGNDPEDVAKVLKENNMKIAGMHIKHNRFFEDLDGIVEEAYLFGCKDIYDKYIDDEEQNEEGYKKTKKRLIYVARKLGPLGFRIGLHNPEYDFKNKVDGKLVMDYITEPVNGTMIYPEVDTYWAVVGGVDPLEYIQKFAYRMPIIHFKDVKKDLPVDDISNNLTEIGNGDVDFLEILKWGEKYGVEYYAIEQDESKIGIFNSLSISFENLVKLSEKLDRQK